MGNILLGGLLVGVGLVITVGTYAAAARAVCEVGSLAASRGVRPCSAWSGRLSHTSVVTCFHCCSSSRRRNATGVRGGNAHCQLSASDSTGNH